MVSPWFSKGSAPQFLKSLGEDATLFVRLRLLSEIAAGLDYRASFVMIMVYFHDRYTVLNQCIDLRPSLCTET